MKFNLPHPITQDINKTINLLNTEKATGPNEIPVKVIKLSANVIDSHLSNIINKDIDLNCYSKNAKVGNVRPIFKKDERTNVTNYQPVSFLNIFSEIYERFINENLTFLQIPFFQNLFQLTEKLIAQIMY